jgi:peroxiredoxin Q/BCP
MTKPFINKSKHSAMYTKYYYLSFLIFSFSLLTTQSGFAQSTILTKGNAAPLFTAKASLAGSEFDFSLKNALAKGPVVVYFYPSAYTSRINLQRRELPLSVYLQTIFSG